MPTRAERVVSRRTRPRVPRRSARGRFVLLASQFNAPLTRALVRGATAMLRRGGVVPADIRVHWVPGAFELPAAAARAVRQRPRPRAVIALGVLLRGETPQYAVIAHGVAQGLQQVAVQAVLPVTFGVIVADTPAQARARAGGTMGNRGAEAARAALDLLTLFDALG